MPFVPIKACIKEGKATAYDEGKKKHNKKAHETRLEVKTSYLAVVACDKNGIVVWGVHGMIVREMRKACNGMPWGLVYNGAS